MTQRLLNIAELSAKLAAVGIALWGFMMKVVMPYREWRQKSFAKHIRAALPELAHITRILEADETCAEGLQKVLAEQAAIREELDLFLELVQDNRDRHNETAALLDSLGLSADRRFIDDRRSHRSGTILDELIERRRDRRRKAEP